MNIYDIAEKSGVSIATISRVLNGGKNVSPKTYERVMRVIREEEYTPNVFARGLGLNTMQTIGILVTDAADTYYARMISYLAEYLHKLGMNVLLSCTGPELADKQRELQLLLSKRVDAVFLAGSAQQELRGNEHIIEAARTIPVIMVNGYVNAPGIINVSANDEGAICDCVTLLAGQGYKRPFYLYDSETYSGKQKLCGYKKGFLEAGLPDTDEVTLKVPRDLADMEVMIRNLLTSRRKFDSIITSEDLLAVAAVKALQQTGRDMPVIGFNNSILAEVSTPTLTSVDNMLEPVCQMAVQLFHEQAQGKETSSRVMIDCRIIERESFRTK